jgi:hypothetical protein
LAEVLPPEGGTPNDWQIPDYLKIAVFKQLGKSFITFVSVINWQTTRKKREADWNAVRFALQN